MNAILSPRFFRHGDTLFKLQSTGDGRAHVSAWEPYYGDRQALGKNWLGSLWVNLVRPVAEVAAAVYTGGALYGAAMGTGAVAGGVGAIGSVIGGAMDIGAGLLPSTGTVTAVLPVVSAVMSARTAQANAQSAMIQAANQQSTLAYANQMTARAYQAQMQAAQYAVSGGGSGGDTPAIAPDLQAYLNSGGQLPTDPNAAPDIAGTWIRSHIVLVVGGLGILAFLAMMK